MSAFVPLIELRGKSAFPVFAPGTVMSVMTPTVSHAAEEDHLHEAEEQEEEEDRAADAEGYKAKVMTTVHHGVPIAVTVAIHHGRHGCGLSAFGGIGDGGCHCWSF